MRQRVSICRALLHNPPMLFMDEPFGALDAMTREQMIMDTQQIWMDGRKTVLFVTHDIDEALKLGDRIAVLRPGGILAQYATPDELVSAPADEFVEDFVGADRMIERLEWLEGLRAKGRKAS
jgi:osmoprotectant transport system ATP-binding protein